MATPRWAWRDRGDGGRGARGGDGRGAAGAGRRCSTPTPGNRRTASCRRSSSIATRTASGSTRSSRRRPARTSATRTSSPPAPRTPASMRSGPTAAVVESGSGKQPPYIYGPPFPVIDKNDPQAGAKIVWNFFYQSYLLGNSHNQVNLDWVGTPGHAAQHRHRRLPALLRRPAGEVPARRATTQNFLFQQISAVTAPADLQGTVALTHRFRDPSQARSGVDLRAGAAPRARGVAGQSLRRLPRLRHVAGRRLVLRRQAGGLRLEAGRRGRDAGAHGSRRADRTRSATSLRLPERRLRGQGLACCRASPIRRRISPASPGGRCRASSCWSSGRCGWSRARRRTSTTSTARSPCASTRKPGAARTTASTTGRARSSIPTCRSTGRSSSSTASGAAPRSRAFTMAQNWKLDRATVSYADPKAPVSQSRITFPEGFFNVDQLNRQGK